MSQDKNSQSGFTLVELAIVLMIIGLLIGGILRGQELMENARIASTIQQVKAYQGAVVTFRDQFGSYPGDLLRATNRIPGCNATNSCGNGDGNGIVGQPGLTIFDNIDQSGANVPMVETSYYWKHMALTHLISGIDPSANPANPRIGATVPSAKVGGTFSVFYATGIGNAVADKGYGNNLRLQGSATSTGIDAGGEAISPMRARQLDGKMDDGLGDSGSVTGDHEWNCDPNGIYLNNPEKTCWMYFSM